jgi:malonate transporter and related proteins
MSLSDASVLALTVGFPNSAAVALPLLTTTYGPSLSVIAALSIAAGAITISLLIKFLRAFTRPVVWAVISDSRKRSIRIGFDSCRGCCLLPDISL